MLRLSAALSLVLLSCRGQPLSDGECTTLLDRYTELLVRSDREGTTAVELLKLQTAARARAAHDEHFAACSREVSRKQFECAMHAENVDRLEQCLL